MTILRRLSAILTLPIVVGACHDSGPTTPPKLATCSPAARVQFERLASANMAAAVGTLVPLQGATASADELSSCLELLGDGGTYLVVPQFPTASGPFNTSYALGSQSGTTVASGRLAASGQPVPTAGPRLSLQSRFDAMLRRRDHGIAMQRRPSSHLPLNANIVSAQTTTAPDTGSMRTFEVLSNPDTVTQFDTVTARLEYKGTNIFIYVDTASPSGGFTSAQLQAFGNWFDEVLYDIDVNAFGPPSDIDNNGHIDVLLSPVINSLTDRTTCKTLGYIAGFFFGADLVPTEAQSEGVPSNAGEVFYAIVPDPNGIFSCAHTVDDLESTTPATFVHEFQHMISFNQHVLVRNASDEVPWLNEGMSHIAESLAGKYYMQKYPPPSGRTDASQLFPDSAEGFLSGDIFNSYTYLLNPASLDDTASVMNWPHDGTLAERGAVWLFLRWLGDQKGEGIFKSLEQTALTGVANVQAQTAESIPSLFGDFSLALYTDSLPGLSRDQIADRFKFPGELSLRAIYNRIFVANNGPSTLLPRPFPLEVTTLSPGAVADSTMPSGTMSFFMVEPTQSSGALSLFFTDLGGASFGSNLKAQVSVFRCPSAAACPLVVSQ